MSSGVLRRIVSYELSDVSAVLHASAAERLWRQ
jgi:hypothetical protein